MKLAPLFFFLFFTVSAQEKNHKLPVAWQITEGLKAPECITYDSDSGFLFLSQIGGGGGMKKDDDGWISKLTPDGKIVSNQWVKGLDAPKGSGSHGGMLWVSDIDKLVGINIAEGKIVKTVPVPGAELLNGVACGPDGAVYANDMFANKVWRYHEGELKVIVEGKQLEHPNGILVQDGKLILGSWGREIQDDFSTKYPGHLFSFDLGTGIQSKITAMPTGNFDGVKPDGQGGFFVTDWIAGKLFQIDSKGEAKVLMKFPKGLADHAFLVEQKLLICPEMLENRLTAFLIEDDL